MLIVNLEQGFLLGALKSLGCEHLMQVNALAVMACCIGYAKYFTPSSFSDNGWWVD